MYTSLGACFCSLSGSHDQGGHNTFIWLTRLNDKTILRDKKAKLNELVSWNVHIFDSVFLQFILVT